MSRLIALRQRLAAARRNLDAATASGDLRWLREAALRHAIASATYRAATSAHKDGVK